MKKVVYYLLWFWLLMWELSDEELQDAIEKYGDPEVCII